VIGHLLPYFSAAAKPRSPISGEDYVIGLNEAENAGAKVRGIQHRGRETQIINGAILAKRV
jgi:hypothetical protein